LPNLKKNLAIIPIVQNVNITTDADGDWFYSHSTESWCKVDEVKCQEISCGPVRGFPCCNDTSIKVSYSDADGEWGVENKKWCLIEPTELDVNIGVFAWHDENPMSMEPDHGAIFCFEFIDFSFADFKKKYDIVYGEVNGNHEKSFYDGGGVRIETFNYEKNDNNNVIFRRK